MGRLLVLPKLFQQKGTDWVDIKSSLQLFGIKPINCFRESIMPSQQPENAKRFGYQHLDLANSAIPDLPALVPNALHRGSTLGSNKTCPAHDESYGNLAGEYDDADCAWLDKAYGKPISFCLFGLC
ncbi:hypothetical protein PG996_006671 [Apiospora saccharicola]|uniref:Uncharacterized protein n=1 Tax=Apiospora saccharicola TaxID=335842 RepID=A0ABR1V8M9_9PEZI